MSASELELYFALQVEAIGLPEPEREYLVPGVPRFRYDFAWIEQKLLVEINGGTWGHMGHSTGKGIARDYRKNRLPQALGWRCYSFTGDEVRSGEAVEVIRQALEAECN